MNEILVADPSTLSAHPAADLFPLLDDAELGSLAEDVASHGLVSPIVILGQQILDGRNRLRACKLASVTPRFVEWTGTGSVAAWIFSVNLHRRHLSTSQRAMLAARAVEVFAVEAGARRSAGVSLAPEERARARTQAASQARVGEGTVHHAQTVISRGAPELVAAVEAGAVAVTAAADLAALPVEEQRVVVRENRVAERAKEVREQRRPAPSPPSRLRSAPAASPPAVLSPPPAASEALHGDVIEEFEEDEGGSTLDPSNRPNPQPIALTAFKQDYRRGTTPKDEAPKVDQIVAAARTALHAWRWINIEWNEDKRWDMRFAIHEAGQIAMHLNHAVARLEEISAICNGRKPAPPSERP